MASLGEVASTEPPIEIWIQIEGAYDMRNVMITSPSPTPPRAVLLRGSVGQIL